MLWILDIYRLKTSYCQRKEISKEQTKKSPTQSQIPIGTFCGKFSLLKPFIIDQILVFTHNNIYIHVMSNFC